MKVLTLSHLDGDHLSLGHAPALNQYPWAREMILRLIYIPNPGAEASVSSKQAIWTKRRFPKETQGAAIKKKRQRILGRRQKQQMFPIN